MSHVYVSSILPGPIDAVWAIARDFNALPEWHPMMAGSRIEEGRPSDAVGCIRNFQLEESGETVRERLLALSDLRHSYSYNILESPLPLTDYTATLAFKPVTDGDQTLGEWWADFHVPNADPQELEAQIGNIFQTGLNGLKVCLMQKRE